MHYLKALIQPASLYSMRLPYTHQSALTYPLPPPSTILGMLAAALQRAENRPPLECLEEIEAGVEACAALVGEDAPIVARSCVVKLITDINKGTTDALPRQFAHTHQVTVVALASDKRLLARTAEALGKAPITLGGSESLAAPVRVEVGGATVSDLAEGDEVCTRAYLLRDLLDAGSLRGHHSLFWVHERCSGAEGLAAYLYPLTLDGHLYRPASIAGRIAAAASRYEIAGETVVTAPRDV
ncbi:MAG: CRISPR-associated protein Cas5 [Armatimonadota bacterium]